MENVKVQIILTSSKILAFTVLIIGSVYAFIFHDTTALLSSMAASSSIIALKTFTASTERKKKMETNYNEENDI